MAFSKIDGLEVTPRSPSSAISLVSSPLFSKSRLTKSSHTDCPYSFSVRSGLGMLLLLARQLLFGSSIDVFAGKPEFNQQFFQRGRSPKRLHPDDRPAQPRIALP